MIFEIPIALDSMLWMIGSALQLLIVRIRLHTLGNANGFSYFTWLACYVDT